MKKKPSKNCVLEKNQEGDRQKTVKIFYKIFVEMIERKQSIFMAQTSFEVHHLA